MKFGQLIIRRIVKIVATMQMSDFKAKMHQNRIRLGLRPRPRWGRGRGGIRKGLIWASIRSPYFFLRINATDSYNNKEGRRHRPGRNA